MSFTTASQHCPTELDFVSADDLANIVTYRSLSAKARPGAHNLTSLNVLTGETACNCRGANVGGGCWHRTLIQAAWEAHPARVLASRFTGEQLLRAGQKAARMLRVTRERTWRVLPADQLSLVACRDEYLKRTRDERDDEPATEVAA